jgi:hypothetical protein
MAIFRSPPTDAIVPPRMPSLPSPPACRTTAPAPSPKLYGFIRSRILIFSGSLPRKTGASSGEIDSLPTTTAVL